MKKLQLFNKIFNGAVFAQPYTFTISTNQRVYIDPTV